MFFLRERMGSHSFQEEMRGNQSSLTEVRALVELKRQLALYMVHSILKKIITLEKHSFRQNKKYTHI